MLTRSSVPFATKPSQFEGKGSRPGVCDPAGAAGAAGTPRVDSGELAGFPLDRRPGGFHRLPEGMPTLRLLVVDDDAGLREACCESAARMGFVPLGVGTVSEALERMRQQPAEMLLLDLKLPGDGGLKLLGEIRALYPKTAVVVMTAFATVSSAVQAMRVGAGDYLTKPFTQEELTAVLEQSAQRLRLDLESRELRERLRTSRGMGSLIGTSPGMEKVYRILSKVAFSTHPVLILGESGTGKELVARSIHDEWAEPVAAVRSGGLRRAGADLD